MQRGLHQKLYKQKQSIFIMETQTITIPEREYTLLKRKAEIADDALVQLRLSLEDLRKGKASKF